VKVTGVSLGDLVQHDSGDVVQVGEIPIELIHTRGHTPGSQCFLCDGHLVAGDTLFLEGCGRVDLPGGDPEEMFRSIHQRLARIPDDTVLFPGHLYAPEPSAPMGEVRASNYVYRFTTLDQWRMVMGG
jgi:glyoxylase-like metal-dependent hydrolase (beta-lactamase superfamily II)